MICARAVASAIVTPDTNTNTDPVTPDTNTSTVTPDTDTAIVTPDTDNTVTPDTDTATPDTDTAAATDKRDDTGSGNASQEGHRGCLCRPRYKTGG